MDVVEETSGRKVGKEKREKRKEKREKRKEKREKRKEKGRNFEPIPTK